MTAAVLSPIPCVLRNFSLFPNEVEDLFRSGGATRAAMFPTGQYRRFIRDARRERLALKVPQNATTASIDFVRPELGSTISSLCARHETRRARTRQSLQTRCFEGAHCLEAIKVVFPLCRDVARRRLMYLLPQPGNDCANTEKTDDFATRTSSRASYSRSASIRTLQSVTAWRETEEA